MWSRVEVRGPRRVLAPRSPVCLTSVRGPAAGCMRLCCLAHVRAGWPFGGAGVVPSFNVINTDEPERLSSVDLSSYYVTSRLRSPRPPRPTRRRARTTGRPGGAPADATETTPRTASVATRTRTPRAHRGPGARPRSAGATHRPAVRPPTATLSARSAVGGADLGRARNTQRHRRHH